MCVTSQRDVQLADGGQDRSGLDDRVDAEVRTRPMGRTARDLDLRPYESAMGDHELELGGLGDDRRVGAQGGENLLDAQARVLLVRHDGDHDVAREPERGGLAAGDQRRRDAGLHVIRATAIKPIAVHPRPPVGHSLHRRPCRSGRTTARAAPARPIRPARPRSAAQRLLEHVDLQPRIARPGRDERRDLALARAARNQRRVHGPDVDQPGQQPGDLVRHPAILHHRAGAAAQCIENVVGCMPWPNSLQAKAPSNEVGLVKRPLIAPWSGQSSKL